MLVRSLLRRQRIVCASCLLNARQKRITTCQAELSGPAGLPLWAMSELNSSTTLRHRLFTTNASNSTNNDNASSNQANHAEDETMHVDNTSTLGKLSEEVASFTDYHSLINVLVQRPEMDTATYAQVLYQLHNLYCSAPDDASKQKITDAILDKLVEPLGEKIPSMDVDALSCSYLYLRKMGVSNTNAVVRNSLLRALAAVESSREKVPLAVLSRLAVGINLGRIFFAPLVYKNFMPHLREHVYACSSATDVRLLAICMFHMNALVDHELLIAYNVRVQQLLASEIIGKDCPEVLLKVLHMANLPKWSNWNARLTREILRVLEPQINCLGVDGIKLVCKLFAYHQEPAALKSTLFAAAEAVLPWRTDLSAMAAIAPLIALHKKEAYVAQLKKLLQSDSAAWTQPNAENSFFKAMRALKVGDAKLCDTYWSRVTVDLDKLVTSSQPVDQSKLIIILLRYCRRYLFFNNNLGGSYRHYDVERKLIRLAMHNITSGIGGLLPPVFAQLAGFVIAYGHAPAQGMRFPNILLTKIIGMAEQFSIQDCYQISHGIQRASALRFRTELPSLPRQQFTIIENVLKNCAERHLDDERATLTATDLNYLVSTLGHRDTLRNSTAYTKALGRYKTISSEQLSSRAVCDMAYNFINSKYLCPEALESMLAYIENNYDFVTGDTVEKVLNCVYILGYTPQSHEVFAKSAKVLLRDFNNTSSLGLVQAALALCFYQATPAELIAKLFCVPFIQRLEEEIQGCYSRARYPDYIMNMLMQLNRAVCLDFPQLKVPWFQQNYLQAQLSKRAVKTTPFKADVEALLTKLLASRANLLCNCVTPYGYQIDFLVNFDKDKRPVPVSSLQDTTILSRVTKVAILLLRLGAYCENDLRTLRGHEALKMKHLEKMGYKVLHVSEHEWQSKYMRLPGARQKYLKGLLEIAAA